MTDLRYLPGQTILTGLPEAGSSLSWTTTRPENWAEFTSCYVYYADNTAQEVVFPKSITMGDFIATLQTMHPRSTGRRIVSLVVER